MTRRDYIETDYVNGVKDTNGELVIRPMTSEEKEWLSQFIAETEHGNFNKTSQIKAEVKALRVLRSEYRAAKRESRIDDMLELEPRIEKQLQLIETLRESVNNFYTTEESVNELYTRDNERRRDVYNNAKISDNLVMYDLDEYDKFSTEAINDVNHENLKLEHIVYVPQRRKKQ